METMINLRTFNLSVLFITTVGVVLLSGCGMRWLNPNSPTATPERSERILTTGFGEMQWFESELTNFAMLRPVPWNEVPGDECNSPGATICFVGSAGGLIITEESLAEYPRANRNREGYIDFLFEFFDENPAIEVSQFAEGRTIQGDPYDVFTLSTQSGDVKVSRFVVVDPDKQIAFNATIFLSEPAFDPLQPLIEYIQDSFRNWNDDDRSGSAIYHLDEALWHVSVQNTVQAIDELTTAIELDPDLRIAYERRAWLHQEERDKEKALADMDRAVALAPRRVEAHHERALMNYLFHEYESALSDLATAIELDADSATHYNTRALVYTLMDDYESALADLTVALELSDGELPANIQDTRAFVYLMRGEFEKSKADYNAIFAQDIRFGYAILGAGIACVGVGEIDEGLALIEEGLAEFGEDDFEDPEPQLGELLKMANRILDENK